MILSGVRPNVRAALEKFGFCELLGEKNICPNINVALEKAEKILAEQAQANKPIKTKTE